MVDDCIVYVQVLRIYTAYNSKIYDALKLIQAKSKKTQKRNEYQE